MSFSILNLPQPLILLIHLHILEYPKINDPQYDINLLNPRFRGLQERAKLTEDIWYFLLQKLEGNKERAKKVLKYPCLKPSDTIAFRTSLAKYLEALRHRSLYPSTGERPNRPLNDSKSQPTRVGPVAWWWKDVVVRKSLLDECSGEKFERLIVAASTHALLKRCKNAPTQDFQAVLHTEIIKYSRHLTDTSSARNTWLRSASLLLQRQQEIRLLRERLLMPVNKSSLKYASLSTERLSSLAESKHRDVRVYWGDGRAERALGFLVGLAGIQSDSSSSIPSRSVAEAASESKASTDPLVLPISAAHHPSLLRKLRKPVLASISVNLANAATPSGGTEQPPHGNPAAIALFVSEYIDAEIKMQERMKRALQRLRKGNEDLALRLSRKKRDGVSRGGVLGPRLSLWQENPDHSLNFHTLPTPELLSSLSLNIPEDGDSALESRIQDIRGSLRRSQVGSRVSSESKIPTFRPPAQKTPGTARIKRLQTRRPLASRNEDLTPQQARLSRTEKPSGGANGDFDTIRSSGLDGAFNDDSISVLTPKPFKTGRDDTDLPATGFPSLLSSSFSLEGLDDDEEWEEGRSVMYLMEQHV